MKECRHQDHEQELFIFPAHHIMHRAEYQRQCKIVPHGIVGLKVHSQRHEQKERQCEVLTLPIDPRQEKQYRTEGKYRKHRQEMLIPEEGVDAFYQCIKARFGHHIVSVVHIMKAHDIRPVIIAGIDAQRCGYEQ